MKRPSLKSSGGQLIVEAILIIVLFFGFTFMIGSYFKEKEFFKKLISGPWVTLAGVMQNGVWLPVDQGAAAHPNGHGRHIVITGDPVM